MDRILCKYRQHCSIKKRLVGGFSPSLQVSTRELDLLSLKTNIEHIESLFQLSIYLYC